MIDEFQAIESERASWSGEQETEVRAARKSLKVPSAPEGWLNPLDAIQAVRDAQLALNGANLVFGDGVNPYEMVGSAGRLALTRLDGVSAADASTIWEAMVDNGENVRFNYGLWRDGRI